MEGVTNYPFPGMHFSCLQFSITSYNVMVNYSQLFCHIKQHLFRIEFQQQNYLGQCESHSVMFNSLWPHGLYSPWNSSGQNTGMDSPSLFQGILPTQGSNPGFPHCGQILYQLSHKGSPSIQEWVGYSISRGSSRPRNQTRVMLLWTHPI